MTFFFMCEYPSNFFLNLIPKPAGEPVFLVFSKHITSWYNDDRAEGEEYTQVDVAYPRWKFLPQSSINYHNQVAFYPVDYTEEEKIMPFPLHENGIRWKILAILWSSEPTLITKKAGDTLVS